MKFCKDICLLFSHRLTSYASQKYNRNNYGLLKFASVEYFKLMFILLKPLHGKISSQQGGISALQKPE